MCSATPPPEVYQLHVWWREISPMIWRRLLVRSDSIIANLHYILQMAMGWGGYYLHHFIMRGKRYGIPQPGGLGFPDDSTQVRLADMRLRLRERFHILPDLVVACVIAYRKPPEVGIWTVRNQARVGNRPPSTSTPHWPACFARR
jgi:hypothetical protein